MCRKFASLSTRCKEETISELRCAAIHLYPKRPKGPDAVIITESRELPRFFNKKAIAGALANTEPFVITCTDFEHS